MAVVSATVSVVCSVLSAPTAPTRRMSKNSAPERRVSFGRRRLWRENRYAASTAAVSALVRTTATPAPAMPSAGIGPMPKMRSGERGTSSATPMHAASDGTSMLPVPRTVRLTEVAVKAGGRGRHDDAPVILLAHNVPHRLGAVDGAHQVNVHDGSEIRELHACLHRAPAIPDKGHVECGVGAYEKGDP